MRSVYKAPQPVPFVPPVTHVSVTLEDGTVLTGEASKVWETVKRLQPVPMYSSDSKGLIPIASMATRHIKNALLKGIDSFDFDLRNLSDKELVEHLESPFKDEEELHNLVSQFIKRIKEGKA
jgi:hypothetical protein